jgi:pimeloyl-ACP methyl ester carboxylesterase
MEQHTCSDGISIAYHRFGSPAGSSGGLPPVVLQHGFAADSSSNWVAPGVVDALVAAGREVIAVDARGHGASDKPHDAAYYGERRMSTDLIELFAALGLAQVDLVGYSMGAIVSAVTASTSSSVRRLVLGGIGAGVAEMGGVDTRRIDRSALADALRTDDPGSIPSPVAKLFRQFADSTGADRLALAAQADSVHGSPIALGSITAPTLVLVGDADELASRPEVLAAAIPGARLTIVAGNHLSAVVAPGFAPAIVEFVGG